MEYKDFALDMARQAGSIILENFKLGMATEWKDNATPVTQTDLDINDLILNKVNATFPEHNILSEEESDLNSNSEYLWVCDPVDGTSAFASGFPTFVFALTLLKDGEPILAVVNDPIMKRTYFAEKGKGAYLNDRRIHVSEDTSLKNTLVGTNDWERADYHFYELNKKFGEKDAQIVNLLSNIYMSMYVATGNFSAVVFPGDAPYDTSANKIIVEEAGGKVTDLFGDNPRYDQPIKGQLITNGLVHNELLELINEYVLV